MSKSLQDLTEDQVEELAEIMDDFQERVVRFVLQKDVNKDQYSELLAKIFIMMLENGTSKTIDVVKFFSKLNSLVVQMYDDGNLNSKLEEKDLKNARKTSNKELLRQLNESEKGVMGYGG